MIERSAYPYVADIVTRWMDNDVYGHVNNVVYYSYFDTAVNRLLIERGLIDIRTGPLIGYVVESSCTYKKPIAFPDRVAVGVGVSKVGRSSVGYALGVFRNEENEPAAFGRFVHVYVDRATQRPTEVPENMRSVLGTLTVSEPDL